MRDDSTLLWYSRVNPPILAVRLAVQAFFSHDMCVLEKQNPSPDLEGSARKRQYIMSKMMNHATLSL